MLARKRAVTLCHLLVTYVVHVYIFAIHDSTVIQGKTLGQYFFEKYFQLP